MTSVWSQSVKRFWSYHFYYILASCHFTDGRMGNEEWRKSDVTGINGTLGWAWAKWRRFRIDISNGYYYYYYEHLYSTIFAQQQVLLVQQLKHLLLFAFKNSRWRLTPKRLKFVDVAWQVDFYCRGVYLGRNFPFYVKFARHLINISIINSLTKRKSRDYVARRCQGPFVFHASVVRSRHALKRGPGGSRTHADITSWKPSSALPTELQTPHGTQP
jgi:hypothetical protein